MDKSIFRAYDIRGVYPSELNEEDAYRIARAIFEYLGKPRKVAVGRDARVSAPSIQAAVMQACSELGAEVIDLGMVSSDVRTFATGKGLCEATIIVSASHNPANWIGLKVAKANGLEMGGDGEIQDVQNLVKTKFMDVDYKPAQMVYEKFDILPLWLEHVSKVVDVQSIRGLKIVVDSGNGVAGPIVREFVQKLNQGRSTADRIKLVELFFEPDGNFPNHVPSPIEPENLKDLRKKVMDEKADIGIAFDGDADRVFLIDEKGGIVTGSEMTALVLDVVLAEDPSRVVLYNAICGWNVLDVIAKHQAKAYRTRVGHGFIKKDMQKHNAYFAGEHSGHYFFQHTYNADSGLIATAMVLELMGRTRKSLSELLAEHRRYVSIPETNFRVSSVLEAITRIKQRYQELDIDELDGVTVRSDKWWCNIRPSQTEPLLRLNIEAVNQKILDEKAQELTELIKQSSRVSV